MRTPQTWAFGEWETIGSRLRVQRKVFWFLFQVVEVCHSDWLANGQRTFTVDRRKIRGDGKRSLFLLHPLYVLHYNVSFSP